MLISQIHRLFCRPPAPRPRSQSTHDIARHATRARSQNTRDLGRNATLTERRGIIESMLLTPDERHKLFVSGINGFYHESIIFLLLVQQYKLAPTSDKMDMVYYVSFTDKGNGTFGAGGDAYENFISQVNISGPQHNTLSNNMLRGVSRTIFDEAREEVISMITNDHVGNGSQIQNPGQMLSYAVEPIITLKSRLQEKDFDPKEMGIY